MTAKDFRDLVGAVPSRLLDGFQAALLSLPTARQEIFVLHDVEGYKHHGIGTLLDISTASKAQLHRADDAAAVFEERARSRACGPRASEGEAASAEKARSRRALSKGHHGARRPVHRPPV
jgi:hypothetical protein